MPTILMQRLPLPSIQTYVTVSAVLLAAAILYTHHTVITLQSSLPAQEGMVPHKEHRDNSKARPFWMTPPPDSGGQSSQTDEKTDPEMAELLAGLESVNMTLPYDNYRMNFLWVLTSEAWCVWTLVNTAYCALILLGKLIQTIVFGELRVSEQQHLKDKFWNFVFYKFIFIFGVMNVQTLEEVVLWVAWFTSLGFLHLLVQLCKDRFEYLSFSPTTPRSSHAKLLGLLMMLMTSSAALMGICLAAGFRFGLTIFAFMAAECVLLGLKTIYVIVRYMIHLWDLSLESVWENRSVYVYYSELIFELASLSIDFAHHLHMLLWGNIFLSMASLVICMQLRYLFYEFQRRIRRHQNYRRVVRNMQARFPMATQEDLELNADECAICWESMEAARKLPCGHLFHNSCLRSWLEQDTSCPTCRMALSERPDDQTAEPNQENPGGANNPNMPHAAAAPNQGTTNHFFHFDGSRYVSWLPSFSVEVTHTSLLPGQQLRLQAQTSQLDSMLRQVQQMFPNFPPQVILEDLRQTRSVEITIDNILENRLQPARTLDFRDDNWDNSTASDPPQQALQAQSEVGAEATQEPSSDPVTEQPTASTSPTGTNSSYTSLDSARAQAGRSTGFTSQADTAQTTPSHSGSSLSASSDSSDIDGLPVQAQGGRFSKSATERMSMLQQRKKAMLDQARRRYLSRHGEAAFATSSSPSSRADDDRTRRREVVLQATERRLNSS